VGLHRGNVPTAMFRVGELMRRADIPQTKVQWGYREQKVVWWWSVGRRGSSKMEERRGNAADNGREWAKWANDQLLRIAESAG